MASIGEELRFEVERLEHSSDNYKLIKTMDMDVASNMMKSALTEYVAPHWRTEAGDTFDNMVNTFLNGEFSKVATNISELSLALKVAANTYSEIEEKYNQLVADIQIN